MSEAAMDTSFPAANPRKRKPDTPDARADRDSAHRTRQLTDRVSKLVQALQSATARSTPVSQLLRSLPAAVLQYLADKLAATNEPSATGPAPIKCGLCKRFIIYGAGLAVHSCQGEHDLPGNVQSLVLQEDAAGKLKCRLCGMAAARDRVHACSLRFLMPVLYDCMGVTTLPDRYNTCDPEGEWSAKLKQLMRRCSALWRKALSTQLAVSVVRLPGENEEALTSTMMYVQPSDIVDATAYVRTESGDFQRSDGSSSSSSSNSAAVCEGVRLVAGSLPSTSSPRFFYHGHVVARGVGKTSALAKAALTRALKQFADGGAGDELSELTTHMRVGRQEHISMVVDPLVFGGCAYKLNHSCAPNLEPVDVSAWGNTAVAVLQPPPGASPLRTHDELFWSYNAVCDTPEEEMPCLCGAEACSGLLVSWKGRGKKEKPPLLQG